MVRTLSTVRELHAMGVVVEVIGPDRFRTLPCRPIPISACRCCRRKLARMMDDFRPTLCILPPKGRWALRRALARAGRIFTTAFHTRFPEYLAARTRLPTRLSYAWLRRFHGAGHGLMVATEGLRQELAGRGFAHLRAWSRGVDLAHSSPSRARRGTSPRPVFLCGTRGGGEKYRRVSGA